MKVTGSATLHAPVEAVWRMLQDPGVLVRTIPGCRELELTGPECYRVTLDAGVASIRGRYSGQVRLTDQREPSSFVLRADAQGGPGTVQADVAVTLCEGGAGCTRLDYHADAVVGGMIGGVGQRMLAAVARRTAAEFFTAVDGVLTGAVPGAAPVPEAAAAPEAVPEAVPVGPIAPPAQPAARPAAEGVPEVAPAVGTTWTAPTAPGASAALVPGPGGPVWAMAVATSVGAFAALAGVALGWALARRPGRSPSR